MGGNAQQAGWQWWQRWQCGNAPPETLPSGRKRLWFL